MQTVILILMYLGFIQSPSDISNPKFQAQYQSEINQIQSQIPGVANATIGQVGDPNSLNVIVDGTPVIIDIQQF